MSCVGLEFILGSIRQTFIRDDLGQNREANYDISDLCNLLAESGRNMCLGRWRETLITCAGVESEIYSAIDRSLNDHSRLARRIYHAGDCVSAQPALELCYHRIFCSSCDRCHETTRICVAAAVLCKLSVTVFFTHTLFKLIQAPPTTLPGRGQA